MADKTIFYVVLILASVLTVWFILTSVIYPTSSPTVSESAVLNNTTAYVFVHTPSIVVDSVNNATINCALANFTITYSNNSMSIKTGGNQICRAGTYTVDYDYRNDPTVLDINFGFIVIFLGIAMLLILSNVFKKK